MRRWHWWVLGTIAVIGALAALLVPVLDSPQLAQRVETRVIEELERATGGKAELEQLTFDWRHAALEAKRVILHGTEAPSEAPLLRAKSVRIGLSWRSLLRGTVHISSLIIEEPSINVIVAKDGTTNIPGRDGNRPPAEALIDMAIGHFEIRNGEARINEKRIPINVRASGIRALVAFENVLRQYRGSLEVAEITGGPLPVSFTGEFTVGSSRLDILKAGIKTAHSSADLSGYIENWNAPRADFRANLRADLREIAHTSKLDAIRAGHAEGTLTTTLEPGQDWMISGPISARGVHVTVGGEQFNNLSARGKLLSTGGQFFLDELRIDALGGYLTGKAEVLKDRRFRAAGEAHRIEIPGDLSARVSGSIWAEGWLPNLESASAQLDLTPEAGPVPVGGSVNLEMSGNQLRFGKTRLELGGSRINLIGSLLEGLAVEVRSSNIAELLPAMRLVSKEVPEQIPVSLEGRPAVFTGQIAGPLEAPRVEGTLKAEKLRSESYSVDDLRADVTATRDYLDIRSVTLVHQGLSTDGKARIALSNWRTTDASTLTGEANFRAGSIAALAKELKEPALDVDGAASGKIMLAGTIKKPAAHGDLRIERARLAGEQLDFAQANFVGSMDRVELHSIELARDKDRIRGRGEWKPGEASFEAVTDAWSVEKYLPLGEPVTVSGSARGNVRQRGNQWNIADLDATLRATSKTAGSVDVKASSSGGFLQLDGQGQVYGASLAAQGRWKLEPGLPGSATIKVISLTESSIQQAASPANPLPFEMKVEGGANLEGPLLEPDRLVGRATLSSVSFAPKQKNLPAGIAAADLTLRNDGPVVVALSPRGFAIERARLVAKDTELEALGNLGFRRANQLNLLLRGRINLAVFSTFKPDLLSSGVSTINARVRGQLRDPQVDGRLAFENASFYLRDVPNGFDQVNGTILFDQTRASIESLTAKTGGGSVSLNGYVGFGQELSYQLQALLNEVRVRYPEGVSTQANGSLTLTGTSRRSLLAGTVTILRAGLTQTTDVGGLLSRPAGANGAVALPANETLRGLRFDLRVETAQSAEFSTQLTKEVEADIDLRIRGTAARPVVLGRVSITQGAVQFFGTDYTINRGEINFVNPVSIEPQVDLDLETRVRGIAVSITFAGPLNRMNMSYRSDPPLQSSEILALLAVGRTPTTATQLGIGGVRGNDLLSSGGTAVLSSALTQGRSSSSQLQRFFGVTRLKIDPQLIGLDNTPQSRLSFEQPISRDVTVTYVQTLARAQGQLVRVQWDLSREFSAIATRDENGILAIDFVFRSSFK